MSKIITKKQLNSLIESTIKEYVQDEDNIHTMLDNENENSSEPNSKGHSSKDNEMSQEEIESAKNYTSFMDDNTMCECGGMMYEGVCEECGSTGEHMTEGDWMEEGKKEVKNPGKYMGNAKQKAGVDDDGDGVPNGADKDPKDGDITEVSVKDLAESVTKTFDSTFLTENMDNFKKLINYKNK